ncbi:MAG: hypothetical protein PHO23_01920 [Candidatus Pacebacteria bacterium]|nr:hypothetical protein [Candidatus Paceibacterota bacterium]
MELLITNFSKRLDLLLPFEAQSNLIEDIFFANNEIYQIEKTGKNIIIYLRNSVTQSIIENIFDCVKKYEKE